MKKHMTQAEALVIAEKLKKAYRFGTDKCPKWFQAVSTAMDQYGGYIVEVCIPGWNEISEAEQNEMLEPFEGVSISLRVVRKAPPYKYKEKVKK